MVSVTATTPNSRRRRRAGGRLIAVVALIAMVALAIGIYAGRALHPEPTLSTDALFALALPDAAGQEQKLAQWRGKVLVVNFWATWCAPCREEMPQFIKKQAELGSRGVQFVGIAADDAGKVRTYVDEIGLNYPALIGGFAAIDLSRTLGNHVMALPFTIIVDRHGNVVHTQLGPLAPAKLRAVLDKAL